jgi:hypothetical protein
MIYKSQKNDSNSYDLEQCCIILLCENFILKYSYKYVINKNFKTFWESIK